MINDKEVKATKSPFAMRPNEEKVYDGKTGYSNVNQAVFMVDMGYVNELHFEMLELISKFEFITSRQIYQLLQMKGIEIKDQNKVNARLENLIKARAIAKYYFKSDEGNGIYRIYCLDKAGKYLLNSREIRTDWVPTNNTKPVHLIKKRLAGNQAIIAYMMKTKYFKNYVVEPVLMAKRQNIRFKVSGGVVNLGKEGKNVDLVFEAVRREPGWEEKFVTKMQLYSEFYEYYNMRDSGFDRPPQLVLLGEDDTHLVEIFKLIVKNKINLRDCKPIYTTDLRQLDETLEKSLITFNYNEEKGKYVMEIYETDMLVPPDDTEPEEDIDVDIDT